MKSLFVVKHTKIVLHDDIAIHLLKSPLANYDVLGFEPNGVEDHEEAGVVGFRRIAREVEAEGFHFRKAVTGPWIGRVAVNASRPSVEAQLALRRFDHVCIFRCDDVDVVEFGQIFPELGLEEKIVDGLGACVDCGDEEERGCHCGEVSWLWWSEVEAQASVGVDAGVGLGSGSTTM